MKYRILLLTIILSILAFGQAGCQMPFGGGSEAQIIGLDFSLHSQAPPSVVEQDTEFQVIATIENYGEIATSARFCVEDTIDDSYGGISKPCELVFISAASKENGNILPRKEIITLPSTSNSFSYKRIQSQPTSIIATLIYDYSTKAKPLICVTVPNPLKTQPIQCRESETIPVSVKAPLIVTKVEKNLFKVSENQVRLKVKIHLKKQIDGTLMLPEAAQGYEDYGDQVRVIEVSFIDIPLICNAEGGIVEIKGTENILSCEGLFNVNGVTDQILNIWLDYSVETKKIYPLRIEGIE